MEKVGLTVSDNAKMEARRRDSERVKQAEKRVQHQHKKYRVARWQAKQRDEDLRIRGEGVTYAAGAFGETEPCMNPKRKKRLSRAEKNFGHICFKVILPTNCVFLLKANLNPDFHKFFPLNCYSCKYGFFAKIWVLPQISQDVFAQTSPILPQIFDMTYCKPTEQNSVWLKSIGVLRSWSLLGMNWLSWQH